MTRLLTVGELTLDDVVVEGEGCAWRQPGGGALYSAIGALAWGATPTVSACVGADYPEALLAELSAAGIDVGGVTRVAVPSLGLWLLYERGGRRHQVEKESGSGFATLDGLRDPLPAAASDGGAFDGVHVAPQSVEGQLRALAGLRDLPGGAVPVTQDLMVEPFIDVERYRSGEALQGVTVLLPSEQEVRQVWGDAGVDVGLLWRRLRADTAIDALVVKRGARGADVVTGDGVVHVPAVSRRPVDPTGAGDAFCGGFLVGLVERGDPVEAAVCGAVSASFVVETRGATGALRALDPERVAARARTTRAAVTVPP